MSTINGDFLSPSLSASVTSLSSVLDCGEVAVGYNRNRSIISRNCNFRIAILVLRQYRNALLVTAQPEREFFFKVPVPVSQNILIKPEPRLERNCSVNWTKLRLFSYITSIFYLFSIKQDIKMFNDISNEKSEKQL